MSARTREEVLTCRTRRPTDMRVPSHLQIVRRRPRWAQSQLQSSAVAMPVTRRALGARFGCVPMGCCGAAVAQHRLQPCTVLPTHPPAVTASSLGVRPPPRSASNRVQKWRLPPNRPLSGRLRAAHESCRTEAVRETSTRTARGTAPNCPRCRLPGQSQTAETGPPEATCQGAPNPLSVSHL